MVGGDPAHPDIAAELNVLVVVHRPAVHRTALCGGAVHQLRVLAQRGDRRPDGGGADRGRGTAAEITGGLTEQDRGQQRAARRIRQTAAAENDITTARDRSADAGAARP